MQVSENYETDKTFVDRMADWRDSLGNDANDNVNDDVNNNVNNNALHPTVSGTRLGSGVVTELVARGGMAAVYKVWNERLELFRAVKLLERAGLCARFETEAMLAAKLRHPNIVETYDAGEWNGLPYIEMEYVDGENLQQALNRRGRFPEAVCCAAAVLIAEALRYAHTLKFSLNGKPYVGIIHRDLKPANIMISTQGEIKLTDFGVARPEQESLHTLEGNIVGTLCCISPEQMEGGAIDRRSDIYSFGAILYEMAAGVKTFPQQNIAELVRHRNTNSFKMPYEHGFPLNAAISNIIIRCLRHDPKKRYPDAASLLEDLRKTYALLSGTAPQQLLAQYFSGAEADVIAGNGWIFAGEANGTGVKAASPVGKILSVYKKLSIREKPPAGKNHSVKRIPAVNKNPRVGKKTPVSAVRAFTLITLAALSLSYVTARLVAARPHSSKISFSVMTASEPDYKNTDGAPDVEASPEPETTPPEPAAPAAPKPKAPPPKTAPAPAKSENDLLNEAAVALNNKQWDTAIRILEAGGAFRERFDVRTLLLLEAYVESWRLDKAQALMDSARAGDAHYLLSAGKFWYYRGDRARAAELLESSLTRPSVSKYRSAIFCDALYYISEIRQGQFRASPTDANRSSALDGWRKVRSACGSKTDDPRFERAVKEMAGLAGD